MEFIGEHLLPGQFGHFFVILSFVASLVAVISFFLASTHKNDLQKTQWLRLGKAAFITQALCIFIIFALVFYICSQHLYEYLYAYKHASKELEPKYLLACIWEGQEGSFLLWSIWNALIGLLLMRKNALSKAPVLTASSLAQFFMMLMILGIYIGDTRIGNSLFSLTRNEINGPIFNQPNYLVFIKDGMGLNVLLRNYWMVIHPPVLFLGFALCLVPFGYAYSGLLTKKYGDWVKPALPWALAATAVLGTGIMMGGKWAYESLSFGGYWAWDPVENASFVPWLIMVAGLHTMLIYKATGHSLRASYFFSILSFSFVLYSTFLTRTGILGDTSVHSFTEAGKAINIMIGLFVASFVIPAPVLFIVRYKKIPAIVKEENTDSREFWMFIGSLVLFFTALFIIAKTSLPVYNKIFGTSMAAPQDVEFSYNKVALMVAIILGLLTALTQYLKYRNTTRSYFLKKLMWPTLMAVLATALLVVFYPLEFHKHGAGFLGAIYLGAFATIYSFFANVFYIWLVLKGKLVNAGASIAHAGFALMIVGMLISSSNKEVISSSLVNGINMPGMIDPMTKQQDNPMENLTLIRDVPTRMGPYEVTYRSDSAGHEKGRKFYRLHFNKKQKNSKQVSESFILEPDVYQMKDNNMSSNPDTKSYLTRDIFTYISYALSGKNTEDTSQFNIVTLKPGDSSFYSRGYIILNSVKKNPVNERYHFAPNDMALMADITVVSKDSMHYPAMPLIQIDSLNQVQLTDDTVYAQNLFLRFAGVTDSAAIRIGIKESDEPIDFVTVKTYIFPGINLVWLGLVIMGIGVILSLLHRLQLNRTQTLMALIPIALALFYLFLLAN